jgi:hypothetical protein
VDISGESPYIHAEKEARMLVVGELSEEYDVERNRG